MSSSRTGILISLKCSISWEYLSISYILQCIPDHLPKQWTIVACQWSLADFWSLWRIVEMLYIFIYWLPHKLAQPVYTGSMPHEVNKVISQPLCTFFFNGWQWRSVLSIHAYMLKICYKSFAVQVAVISRAPQMTDLCAQVSSVSFPKPSGLILILLWLAGVPLRLS